MDNGVSDIGVVQYITFKVIELRESMTRYLPIETVNNLTLRSAKSYVESGIVYFTREPLANIEDTLRIPYDQHVCITNIALNEGDLLNKLLIRKVERRLGITRFWIAGENEDAHISQVIFPEDPEEPTIPASVFSIEFSGDFY
jgi:hypothetical protein